MREVLLMEGSMVALFAILWAIPATRHLAHRLIRTGKVLAKDARVPRWAKVGFLLATLPIPGPFDEIVGGLTALMVWRFGGPARDAVREAWATS